MSIIFPQRLATHAPMGSLLKRAQAPRRVSDRNAALSDIEHLICIRALPCLKCGLELFSEAAHIRQNSAAFGKRQAIGAKPADCWTVPLCSACHRHDVEALHRVGEQNFFQTLDINPFLIATALYAASGDLVRMRAIVLSAIAERAS